MAKRRPTNAVTTEVMEEKKAEIREEKAREEAAMSEPLNIIDDITEDGEYSGLGGDVIEEIEEEPPKLVPKRLSPADEEALIADLRATLKVPKTKDAIPVFSMYTIGDYNRRYFLLDVDGVAYRKAWDMFKERTGTKDQVKFLELVYQILNIDMPRLHRAVDWVPLN